MEPKIKPLPQNIEAEQAVLGAFLIDSRVINEVLEILAPGDFYKEADQKIFQAMIGMHRENRPIDILTLFDYLKSKGRILEEVGGSSYLTYLTQIVPSTTNICYYARLVKEKAKERRLQLTLREVDDKLCNEGISFAEAAKQINLRIEKEETLSDSTLRPVSAKDLQDTELVESLWGELIYPECITQINSEPGIGKTTLLYNICVYGAMGKDFLAIPFPERIKTLYLDLETPQWLRRPKLERIVGSKNLPENIFFHYTLDLKTDYTKLLTLCKKEKYDLVVFDTQSRVLAMDDENDNAEANYMLNLMRRLTNETGCALCLIHHGAKSESSKGVYKGRGASAIAGGVDIVVNLEALDEEIIKLTVSKNRIVGTHSLLYLRKAGEDIFETYTPPGESSGFEIFKAQDFIVSLPDGSYKTEEIYQLGKEKKFSESTLKRALSRLVEAGK